MGVAREALAAGRAASPDCGSRYSRRDYAQVRLSALLALRRFLRADYRGVVALVVAWAELRRALGLTKAPHHEDLGIRLSRRNTGRRWPKTP